MAHGVRDALLEELERALRTFERALHELHEDRLDAPVPGKDATLRDVLAHVVDAAYRHVSYVARACGGELPTRRFALEDLSDLDAVRAGIEDAMRFARAALADVDDAILRGPRFPGRGGGDYDGEQMLEHAIVHPYRHLRQLRRLGFVAEDMLDAPPGDA